MNYQARTKEFAPRSLNSALVPHMVYLQSHSTMIDMNLRGMSHR